jgi:two-component system chemotaxis sensor kinase CheA
MDVRDYLALFLEEASELSVRMAQALQNLRLGYDAEQVKEFFRAAHSLKGMAASMGYDEMQRAMHDLEGAFQQCRDMAQAPSDELLDAAFQAADTLSAFLDDLRATGQSERRFAFRVPEPPPAPAEEEAPLGSGIFTEAEILSETLGVPEAPPVQAPAGFSIYAVTLRMDPADPLPAARAMVACKAVEAESERVLECVPSVQQIASGKFGGVLRMRLISRLRPEEMRKLASGLTAVQEALVEQENVAQSFAAGKAPATPEEAQEREAAAKPAGATARVPVEALDRFFNAAGEFLVHHSKLQSAARKAGAAPVLQLLDRTKHLIDDFYNDVVRVRMMPFEQMTPRLERIVREAARSCGKKAAIEVRGGEVTLDRSVLDELMEPMTHILRNAVDHGIEDSFARSQDGKDPEGRILIRLQRLSDTVEVTVADDGAGMDPERIKASAVSKGYLGADAAAALGPEEALMLCTLPGFSTRSEVTDLSGRGVGMDVVRTKIETLGGHLWIRSTVGKGTEIGFRLPPTTSIMRVFVVEDGGESYAVPLYQVHRTLQVRRGDLQRVQDQHWFKWQDYAMAVHSMAELLERRGRHDGRPARELPAEFPCLVVRRAERFHALAVERVVGTQDVVVKPLHVPLEEMRQYSGAAVFGDGRLALILDTENLLAAAPREGAA